MLFTFGFYSSLLLISFSHGIVYSLLLLKKGIQTEVSSNYWLSIFIFVCCLYIAPWMLGFGGWYDNQPYRDILFYTPFQHLFLIGPLMYFYIQSLLNPSFSLNIKNSIHFVPGILYLLYSLSLFVYDKLILGDYYFYQDGSDKDFDEWYQTAGQLSMLFYFIISIRFYNKYRELMQQVVSYADSLLFKWIKTFLYSFLIMLILPVVFDALGLYFTELNSYKGSWWFFLFFSLVLYYIAIEGYANAVVAKIPFEISVFEKKPALLLANPFHSETEVLDIDFEFLENKPSEEITFWKDKIESIIIHQKLYQDPELSLTEVAKKLQTNASIISKAINQGFQMNFNDYINHHRVESVKKAFTNGEHKTTTLLGIAYDCGFNSKATFNRAFKKNTGLSPKEYIAKL